MCLFFNRFQDTIFMKESTSLDDAYLALSKLVNEYPNNNNLDIRKQSTNFANIPIKKEELKIIFDEYDIDDDSIDAFVLTPLNSNDFPKETLDYLRSFDVPIFVSLQGFLRFEGEDNSMILKQSDDLDYLFSISETIFLDEGEFEIINDVNFEGTNLVITNGSKGSRILGVDGTSIKINSVQCENIVDATGCGNSYMAAYISTRLNSKTLIESGNFASLIASEKLKMFGPYRTE